MATPRGDIVSPSELQSSLQNLVRTPDSPYFMCNLSHTFEKQIEGATPYEIREMFDARTDIPFKLHRCSFGGIGCCGTCTKSCIHRCAQDVVFRAHLACGNILYAATPEIQRRRYLESGTAIQMLYDELTSPMPKYFVIAETVREMISRGGDNRLDYAPTFEFEEFSKVLPGGQVKTIIRKKADPETGETCLLAWPRSGVCPFCLPTGLVDPRRTVGNKNRRKPSK